MYSNTSDMRLRWRLSCVRSEKSLEGFALLLGSFFVSNMLGGGSEVVNFFLWLFLCNLSCLSRTISTGVSTLVVGLLAVCTFVRQRLYGLLLVPQFPVMTRAPKFLDRTVLQRSGKFLPAFCFPHLVMEKVFTGF